ncbi:MAG: histidine kinase [Bacteroidales bacterium]|nr:histidine kinase [Bacteroidales bacterium]
MRRIGTRWIIHGFAALHVVAVVVCALLGWPDSLLLTALTMALTVMVCYRRNLTVEFTAICVLLVNILGYVLGHLGADMFNFQNEILNRALASFVTTEIIGWALDLYARTWHIPSSDRSSWRENLGWLVFAIIAVFALRLFIELFIFRKGPFEGMNIVTTFRSYLSNSLVLLGMFVGTLFFVRSGHDKHYSLDVATIGTTLFIGLISILGALLHTFGLPFHWTFPIDITSLARNIVAALLVEMTVFGLVYVVEYAFNIRRELGTQRERRHLAEYRYMALKNQVNPHFLFNSLNILDSIVQDGEQEEASTYIHKLAGIYRYMLQHDGEKLVRLNEEVTFVTMYYDLLKIRFPEGISVENDILPEDLSRMVVPCTLQLLVENVTKHNAISPEAPVRIRVATDGRYLTLENNRRPRASEPVSTGLGLPYIRKQYLDISGEDIRVEKTDDIFRVRIPLL